MILNILIWPGITTALINQKIPEILKEYKLSSDYVLAQESTMLLNEVEKFINDEE